MGLFSSKRPKSALMRDRAYKSDEPHEQAYRRKTRPKNPRYMADGGGVDVVIYNPKDLQDFWANPKNSNKTIYFVEEMEEDDGTPYYVVGNQTKKYYEDNQYWDFDYNFDDVDEAVKQAKLDSKKNKGIYAENLRVIRGYANGGGISENAEQKRSVVESYLRNLSDDELYYIANEYADLDWDDDANLSNQIEMWIDGLSSAEIDMIHQDLLGYRRGGRVYKKGRAYKADRARFNKSEDWEIPMNRRGKGKRSSSASSKSAKGKYSYIPNIMLREAEVERNGKTTYIDGADILDGIYVKAGTKYATGGGVGEESLIRENMVNGEIHCNTLTEIIGCTPNYPCHNVGSLKLTKCFLRPYYKVG